MIPFCLAHHNSATRVHKSFPESKAKRFTGEEYTLKFTLSHTDVNQEEKQKPGYGRHLRRGSRRSSSFSVSPRRVPHDEESNYALRRVPVTEKLIWNARWCPSLRCAALQKPSQPGRKRKRKWLSTKYIQRSVFANMWHFMKQEVGASPSVTEDVALKSVSACFSL